MRSKAGLRKGLLRDGNRGLDAAFVLLLALGLLFAFVYLYSELFA
jgi:hypothetical protein